MTSHHFLEQPSAWVMRFSPLIGQGNVLDLACGSGRHARHLAERGLDVLAVDRDPLALSHAKGDRITTLQFDLEASGANQLPEWPFKQESFAGIVVANYLHRPLFEAILHSLAPGGVLIYETFASGNERFGKPSNPDFLLQTGELLKIAQGAGGTSGSAMRIVAYEDGYVALPKPAMVQRICLLKPDPDDGLQRILPI